MLKRYFQHQAHLAGTDSDFLCPEDCDAPGCWMEDTIVEVTLFDLIRLGLELDIPVSGFFADHCRVGLQTCETNPRYMRLLIKLNKPCRFFKNARCLVQRSKPLICILFPEYQQIAGLLPELSKLPVYRHFPCLKKEIRLSDERRAALQTVRSMSWKEEALSCFYLFGISSYIVDAKPLTRQMKKDTPGNRFFTIMEYDNLLGEILEPAGFFTAVTEKVRTLDTKEGMEDIFAKLEDNKRMGPLLEQMSKPTFAHIIKGGKIKRVRRILQRPEIFFL
ncbi:MAG: hypothetical protein ABII68_08535 [Pseudomonadota bacterium]